MQADDAGLPKGYDGPPVLSASQIITWTECKRKWGWDKIARIPRPQGPGAALGERVHKQLEGYLLEGKPLQYTTPEGEEDESGYIAATSLEYLPQPKTPGMEVEGKKQPGGKREGFRFQSPRTGIVYMGYIDWRTPPVDGVPTVGDHKTTSSISQWAKTVEDLKEDPQAILYAVDTMAKYQVPRVRLQWTYMQTKGTRKALPVILELDSEHVAREFARLETVAVQISTTLNRVVDSWGQAERSAFVESLEPNPDACRNYGGCPYTGVCNLGPRDFWRSKLPKQEGEMSQSTQGSLSLIERLRNRAAEPAAPTSVPPPSTSPAGGTITYDKSWSQAPSEAAQVSIETLQAVQAKAEANPTGNPAASSVAEMLKDRLAKTVNTTGAATLVPAVAINPPGEYQPPPTAEQRAAAVAPVQTSISPAVEAASAQAEAPKKRGRPRKNPEQAAPVVAQQAATAVQPGQMVSTTPAGVAPTIEAEDPLVDVLFIDCEPVTDEPHMTGAELVYEAGALVQAAKGVDDYRFLEFGQGPGALTCAALEYLEAHKGCSLTLDTRTPEGAILCNPITARAAHVVRGLR